MENITHNNHYVPQFYLRNFSKDKNKIWVYSLLVPHTKVPYWEEKSIKHVAVWKDFYTRIDGTDEIDDFEKWFNTDFETPAEPIISKLINGEIISKQESVILTKYVLSQHIRVPAQLGKTLNTATRSFQKVLNSNPFEKLDKEAIQNYTPKDDENAKLLPIKVNVDMEARAAEVKAVVGRGVYLYALKSLMTNTVKKVQNQNWQVLHAAPGLSFPTSDNPVICLNYRSINDYDFNGGWGRKNGNIIMPISPQLILFTQIGSTRKFVEADYSPYWSKFFRKLIIEHAYRYVYAEERQRHMLAINPRSVNLELFLEEKKAIEGWNEEQIRAERELWND